MIQIKAEDLRKLLEENKHFKTQVQDLQEGQNKLVQENRELKAQLLLLAGV